MGYKNGVVKLNAFGRELKKLPMCGIPTRELKTMSMFCVQTKVLKKGYTNKRVGECVYVWGTGANMRVSKLYMFRALT